MGVPARDVHVFDDADAVARAAAAELVGIVSCPSGDRRSVCLSGGTTPLRLFAHLLEAQNASRIPWHRIDWFWGDERFVPLTDPRSNAGTAWRAFLSRTPRPVVIPHAVALGADRVEDGALLYEQALKRFYGANDLDAGRPLFDLVLLGLGEDGHTASLFPGTRALDERVRWVTSVERAGQVPFVPRLTLTLPALGSAREALFMVSGAGKRDALARCLGGDDLPAARVRTIGRQRWFVDRAAANAGVS